MGKMKVILSLDEYSIYMSDNYYLCIPNTNTNFYHVFMGFSYKDLTTLSQEDLIIEIRKVSDSINAVYKNAVYVLPIIDPFILKEATDENDDRGYNKILKNIIQPTTLSVYCKLAFQNKMVSQVIKMIKQNDADKKLVGWLSMKLGNNFIKEITFEERDVTSDKIEEEVIEINTKQVELPSTQHKIDDVWIKKQEESISDTLKPVFSPGFSALKFLLMMVGISLVLGTILWNMIIK